MSTPPDALARRTFLGRIAAAGGGALLTPSLAGLGAWSLRRGGEPGGGAALPGGSAAGPPRDPRDLLIRPYGPLVPAAGCPEIEIPEDFRCVRLSSGGVPSTVRPEFQVPNAFDGMAAFPLPNGNVRLIRNHEMTDAADQGGGAFASPAYDGRATGGCTSLEVRVSGSGDGLEVELIDEFPSLAGTVVNCAGGATPWGSWLSCEEITWGRNRGYEQPHGYLFEVPADADGPVDPVPLKDMGRFVHEAVAVDPDTGVLYETEDAWYVPNDLPGAGFYRFIPREPGRLAAGGRLQMLAVTDRPGYLTARGQTADEALPTHWVDIANPDPPDAARSPLAVFWQGFALGGARFARLEGAFHGDDGIYIVSTNGGEARSGQVFHYRPLGSDEGELRLVFESPSAEVLDSPDNIVLSPRGGLVMCEDGSGEQYVRGLDREGRIVNLVRAPHAQGEDQPGEFAGSCFSPDGRVLFFNVQGGREVGEGGPSATYALWGPWENGPL